MALTRIQPPVQPPIKPPVKPLVKPLVKPDAQLETLPQAESVQASAQTTVESAQADQSRMAEVTLLLEAMFEREEATVELILNCLYDIGSIHWIDQRVKIRSLNRLAQWSARWSRPVVKLFAMRWFKRNCPRLITNWLYTKVKFEPQQFAQAIEAADAADIEQVFASIQAPLLAEIEGYRRQVSRLQFRVRLLTLLLVGAVLTLGGGLAWSVWQLQLHPAGRSADRSAS